MLGYALVLAGVWGVLWAVFLQFVPLGRFLALRRTWVTVVIGCGVNMLILLMMMDPETVLKVFGVWAISALGIIVRSVWNEWADEQDLEKVIDVKQNQGCE